MAFILVIDDDVGTQELIKFVLQKAGHQVLCAQDGVAGLQALRQHPADLVLCDLFMPKKDGLETIRELHRDFPQVKVVAISGGNPRDGWFDFLPFAKKFGAVAVLPKPFLSKELTAVVEQVLGG